MNRLVASRKLPPQTRNFSAAQPQTNERGLHALPCEAGHEQEQKTVPTTSVLPKIRKVQIEGREIAKTTLSNPPMDVLLLKVKLSRHEAPAITAHQRTRRSRSQNRFDETTTPDPDDTIRIMEWAKNMAIKSVEHAVEQERILQNTQKFKLRLGKWRAEAVVRNVLGDNMTESDTSSEEDGVLFSSTDGDSVIARRSGACEKEVKWFDKDKMRTRWKWIPLSCLSPAAAEGFAHS